MKLVFLPCEMAKMMGEVVGMLMIAPIVWVVNHTDVVRTTPQKGVLDFVSNR
jgi:uncharacterized membrane protein